MNNTDHQDLCTRRVAQVEKSSRAGTFLYRSGCQLWGLSGTALKSGGW